jgi:hypothetical protein
MNRFDRKPLTPGEAIVEYLDGDLRIVVPGRFVLCAVSGVQIPLDDLRYWSVARQEAYATRDDVLKSMNAINS